MENYLNLKKECCEKQKQDWQNMLNTITNTGEINIINGTIQSEKMKLFDHYIDLKAALEKIPDKNFVEIERSKMFEKMVELAEFNNGTDLGVHYFQVRRGAIATKPTAFIMAIMGPGYVETSNLISADDLESELDKVQILYFGKKVTAILPGTCEDMTRLKNVYFHPDTLCSIIDDSAFQGCAYLKEMIIPNKVKSIGYACFADCESLSSMIFGNKVESIWHSAFQNCTELKKIHVSDSVKYIGDECFKINTEVGYEGGLNEITGMKNLEELGNGVFMGTEIESFTGGPKLKKIGSTCFMSINTLQTLTLEYNRDLEIGDGAFESLDYLKIINLKGGTPKKWVEKLKGQFFNCYEIDNLTESYKEQIQKIRELNSYDTDVSNEVIYIAYARILEQEEAQLMKGGSTGVQIPQDITRYLAEGFSPSLGQTHVLQNNQVITFNGNGGENWTSNHYVNLESMKPTYSPTIGQYYVLFSNVLRDLTENNLNVNDYYVLCPIYQNNKRNREGTIWYDYFDYQIAVTGKAKRSESDANDRIIAMQREVNEELNVSINIQNTESNKYFKRFKFGWGIVDYSLPVIQSFTEDIENFDRRVIVAVLEDKNNLNIEHINNHSNIENDIIGFIRKDLHEVINILKLDINREIKNSNNSNYTTLLKKIKNEGYI
jgi:hypothetical protein